ncbi:MAG: hypothetical protein P8Y70_08530 [Candidatus Lokiarchaeota archaeon]
MTKKAKKYECPRCGSKEVVNFKNVIFCKECREKFNKQDLEEFDKDQVLSSKEKSDVFQAFKDFAERDP